MLLLRCAATNGRRSTIGGNFIFTDFYSKYKISIHICSSAGVSRARPRGYVDPTDTDTADVERRPMPRGVHQAPDGPPAAPADAPVPHARPRITVFAPAPLLTVAIEAARGDDDVHLHAGGQGLWVARMARSLGADADVCVPLGGEAGAVLRELARNERLVLHEVETAGHPGTYVDDRRSGQRVRLAVTPPSPLGRHELDDLYALTLAAGVRSGVVVLTGSEWDDTVPDDVFRRLAVDLAALDCHVVADLSGDQLAAVVAGGPRLVKVSDEEAVSSGWAADAGPAALWAAIARMREAGAHDVVVSRAQGPTLAVLDGRHFEARVPRLQVVDHRGSGDSMTAALAVGLARGVGCRELLASGLAAGALNATGHGMAEADGDLVEVLAGARAEVVEVEPARAG
jgi:1-phosphofructokinase